MTRRSQQIALWGILVLFSCGFLLVGVESAPLRTMSKSLVLPSGKLTIQKKVFSNIEFTNPSLYPRPKISLILVDEKEATPAPTAAQDVLVSDQPEGTENSFVLDDQNSCRSFLVNQGVLEQPWERDFLNAAEMTQIHLLEDVIVPGVGGEAERVEKQPQARSYQIDLAISADPKFWYKISTVVEASYVFHVPAMCTRVNSAPAPVKFAIAYEKRTAYGRTMTYLHLAASSVALHNVLSGSMISLSLLQQFAIINANGCAPVILQEEAHVESYAVNPIQVRMEMFQGMSPEMMRLFCSIFLVVCAWFLEGIHWMVIATRHRAKATQMAKEAEEERELEEKEKELREQQQQQQQQQKSKSHSPKDKKDTLKKDTEEGSEGDGAEKQPEQVHKPVKYVPRDSKVTKVQAPYLALALTMCLMSGIVYNSTKVIFGVDSHRYQQGIALLGIITHGLLPIILIIGVSRVKELKFVPYLGSFKGSIPAWLQPQGVWGPNAMRLTLGPFIEDFKSSRRLFGLLVLFYQFVLTVANGSSNPAAETDCRNTLWFGLMTNVIYLCLVYYMRPFRSPFINLGFSLQLALLTCHYGMVTAWGGYVHREDHWTHDGVFATGMAFNAVSFLYNLGIAGVARWEFYGGRACRHVTQNMDFVGKSRVQYETTDEVIDSLLKTYTKSGEETREKEKLRQQLVPLEEDDTAAIRYFTQTGHDETAPSGDGPQGSQVNAPALTLADYLLQDMDRLPEDTKVQFHLEQELHLERLKNSKKLNIGLNLHPDDIPTVRNNPNYIKPRTKPVRLQNFDVYKEKPIPSVFVLEDSRNGFSRDESAFGRTEQSTYFESPSPIRKTNASGNSSASKGPRGPRSMDHTLL